jgi:hypothetical protein
MIYFHALSPRLNVLVPHSARLYDLYCVAANKIFVSFAYRPVNSIRYYIIIIHAITAVPRKYYFSCAHDIRTFVRSRITIFNYSLITKLLLIFESKSSTEFPGQRCIS